MRKILLWVGLALVLLVGIGFWIYSIRTVDAQRAAALASRSAPQTSAVSGSAAPSTSATSEAPASSPAQPNGAQPVAAVSPTATPNQPAAVNSRAQAVVIGYHRITDRVRHPDTEISPADFEAQMQQLADSGIKVIPLQDLLAWKRGEKDIPARSAVLTFDDGWKSQYEVAWPILKKFKYPFTLFIYTDYVKGGPKAGGDSTSWEQLAEMRDAGADIEGHTASHHDLRGKRGRAQAADYENWLWNELYGSKQILEQHLAVKVNALALPYGYYNEHVLEMARKAGYEAVLTVNGQPVTASTSNSKVGRYIVQANQPQIFASAIHFGGGSVGLGTGMPPAVAELTNGSMPSQPPNGAVLHDPQPAISASMKGFGTIDAGTASMRVSGLGKVDAKYDPQAQTLSFKPSTKLRSGSYTVIVSALSQGKRVEGRWTFSVEEAAPAPTGSPTPEQAKAAPAS